MQLLLGAVLLAPCVASAQDQAGPQDLTRNTTDPIDRLVGLWRVDKIEGAAPADVGSGQVLRIDRQSVATLTQGTCSNPSFDEDLGAITVTCLGQDLASAAWNPEQPGNLYWVEGGLRVELSRISGTEAIDSPPPAAGEATPDEGTEGAEDAE
ncbi:hypothetical protein DLREEDagr8_08910 [Dongia sp. agr-C8]